MRTNSDGAPTVDYSEIEILEYREGGGNEYSESAWKIQLGGEEFWYERWVTSSGSGAEWYSESGGRSPANMWDVDIEVTSVPRYADAIEGESKPILVHSDGVENLADIIDELVVDKFMEAHSKAHEVLVKSSEVALRRHLFPFRLDAAASAKRDEALRQRPTLSDFVEAWEAHEGEVDSFLSEWRQRLGLDRASDLGEGC